MTTQTREHVTRQLWATWNLIPADAPYGMKETVYGSIPRHLAARQWPGRDVSMYQERPDDTYPTGRTDKPDGRWTDINRGQDQPRTPTADIRLSCPVCRDPISHVEGKVKRVFCSDRCRKKAARSE